MKLVVLWCCCVAIELVGLIRGVVSSDELKQQIGDLTTTTSEYLTTMTTENDTVRESRKKKFDISTYIVGRLATMFQDSKKETGILKFVISSGKSFEKMGIYLINSIRNSVKTLFGLEKIYEMIQENESTSGEHKGRGVKKETHHMLSMLLLKTFGIVITKLMFAFGFGLLKIILVKMLFMMHHVHSMMTQHNSPKYTYKGPLVKAYHTTSNEVYIHRGKHRRKVPRIKYPIRYKG